MMRVRNDRKGKNWLLDDPKDEEGDKDANDGDNWLVDNKRPVLQARPSRSFHLPELLQLLHHVHCKCFRFTNKLQLYLLKLISVQTCFYACFKTFICKRFLLAWRNMLTTQKIVHNQLPAGVLSIIANCPLLCFSLPIISCWDSISGGVQKSGFSNWMNILLNWIQPNFELIFWLNFLDKKEIE